jgi:hypothetical protein
VEETIYVVEDEDEEEEIKARETPFALFGSNGPSNRPAYRQ